MSISPKAYLFDMDHTLINNDCDVSWKTFMVDRGLAQSNALEVAESFYQDYLRGELDVESFTKFQLKEFAGRSIAEVQALSFEHFTNYVKSTIYQQAAVLVKTALAQNVPIAILTATNKTLAQPVAEYLDIPTVLACDVKQEHGFYCGEMATEYSLGEGKIAYAKAFLEPLDIKLSEVAYYGDSVADIPMLEQVGFAFAINPTGLLLEKATELDWHILNFS
ncbi:MAG: HAD-IB family hydrolase [Lentisphaeria bacterium]|nr:HAD-IB family hydrolase [Lentisphaeria bacterium]